MKPQEDAREAIDFLERDISERNFYALAEAAPVILWTATADGWIDWYNRHWYDYTGQTAQEAAGWGWQAVHHPEDFPEVMRRWPESIATGKPFEMEFRLRGADGVYRWFLTRIHPLRSADGIVQRWYGSNVDVDEQRRGQERTQWIVETLQELFLPKSLPQRSGMQLDAVYIASEADVTVGGDWYDAFDLDGERTVVSIGDVAGHGVKAAVIAGSLRQANMALSFCMPDCAGVMHQLDRIIQRQWAGTVATALTGIIDMRSRTFSYVNAGHPLPIVAAASGELADVPLGDLALGVRPEGAERRMTTITIAAGMTIALYTDGVIEAGRDILAGENTLRASVSRLAREPLSPSPARALLRSVVGGGDLADDAALLLLRF